MHMLLQFISILSSCFQSCLHLSFSLFLFLFSYSFLYPHSVDSRRLSLNGTPSTHDCTTLIPLHIILHLSGNTSRGKAHAKPTLPPYTFVTIPCVKKISCTSIYWLRYRKRSFDLLSLVRKCWMGMKHGLSPRLRDRSRGVSALYTSWNLSMAPCRSSYSIQVHDQVAVILFSACYLYDNAGGLYITIYKTLVPKSKNHLWVPSLARKKGVEVSQRASRHYKATSPFDEAVLKGSLYKSSPRPQANSHC